MTKQENHGHEQVKPAEAAPRPQENLDAAGRSLSDALKISFSILKVIMIILVIAFLASGFRTVGSDEKALVLRFGKIREIGQQKVLGPGLKWILPYPVDEMIKIPVERKIDLAVNSFWYKQTSDDILGERAKPRVNTTDSLDPIMDGYCLTRSEPVAELGPAYAADGMDYNIVHSRWKIIYHIQNLEEFFRNVYMPDVRPGQVYVDVMTQGIEPLLRSVVENAVVSTLVHYTIDDAIKSQDRIPMQVRQMVQGKLDAFGGGITVDGVQIVDVNWPKQVNDAFQAYVTASQKREQAISEARTYATNTLNETGGPAAEQLYEALAAPDSPAGQDREGLWGDVAGTAKAKLDEADTYRMRVVSAAQANAKYLMALLPEYRKRPDLVVRDLYLDTLEQVLNNADEKIIVEPSQGSKGSEVRITISRDPTLKPRPKEPQPARQ